jgi:protein disulfide-isomerase
MKRTILAGLAVMMMAVFNLKAETASEWVTDFEKASTNASKSGAFMLLDFSGSDWCGWCKKLDKEVFSKPEFKKYAKENLVCVLVDFPQHKPQTKKLKDQNTALAKKYGVRGYPTVVILSNDGSLVGTTGYMPGGPQKYVDSLKAMIDDYKQKNPPKVTEGKTPTNPLPAPTP